MNNVAAIPPSKPSPQHNHYRITAKADSGATKHFWRDRDKHILHNRRPTTGPPVALPDGSIIRAHETGDLPLKKLNKKATTVQVFKNLTSSSLLSVGQLCDDGCKVNFDDGHMIVSKDKSIILQGTRNKRDGLYDVTLKQHKSSQPIHTTTTSPGTTTYKANVIIQKSKTKADLAQYLHACCFSPAPSTLIRAINNGNMITWPGLTPSLIRKHLEKSVATAKGHLDQEQKNLQSTKTSIKIEDEELDFNPVPHTEGEKTHNCFALIVDFQNVKKAYLDLTGRFPFKSSRGKQYFLIVYDYDSNAILAETLKTRQAGEIKAAWLKIHEKLKRPGAEPALYIMDNEASTDLKSAMTKNNLSYQLVPPDQHRRNAAEKAIRTFKNHFIAVWF